MNIEQKVIVYGQCSDVSATGEYSIDMDRLEANQSVPSNNVAATAPKQVADNSETTRRAKDEAKFDKAKLRIGNAASRLTETENPSGATAKEQAPKSQERIFVGDSAEKLLKVWGQPTDIKYLRDDGKSFTYVYDGNRMVIVVVDKGAKIVGFIDTRGYPKVVSEEDAEYLSPP